MSPQAPPVQRPDPDLQFRSPWLDQLDPAAPPMPLRQDHATDVVIVGAGIAGIATAYFVLRETSLRVTLLERSRAGHGASGRNAGQMVTYFERPLTDLVASYGLDLATAAQAEVEAAWDVLDLILQDTGISVPIERFDGAMGMYTLGQVLVHLEILRLRRTAGLAPDRIEISASAGFLDEIPAGYRDLYTLVPQEVIQDRLRTLNGTYVAVLVSRKGCGNSALLCQELLKVLRARHADRFVYADMSQVDHIALHQARADLSVGAHLVTAGRVILCTNGFNHHVVENRSGPAIPEERDARIHPRIGYMAGFIEPPQVQTGAESFIVNREIGGPEPYFYTTRRPYEVAGRPATLTCLGGPEVAIADSDGYDMSADLPQTIYRIFEDAMRPALLPDRPAGLPYDYTWHGLMAYSATRIRRVGIEPRNPVLLYNVGCNGVGFLPSLSGARRIARLLSGEVLPKSLFDPD